MYSFSIVNKLPQAPWFKTTHVYYLTVSVHQGSRLSLAGSSAQRLTRLTLRCQSSTFSPGGLTREEPTSTFIQIVGKFIFLKVYNSCSLESISDPRDL